MRSLGEPVPSTLPVPNNSDCPRGSAEPVTGLEAKGVGLSLRSQ